MTKFKALRVSNNENDKTDKITLEEREFVFLFYVE